ncbi:MAG: MXAN_5187 C-terminal domain-containing protein [Polyangiaceae bacterium]
MELKEIEMNISELELRLDRLRALYDQYFMGYEKLEPQVQRKDIDRRFQVLRKENFRNTALRFRLNVAVQKYSTYQTYWQRICRQIEEGTYKRHVQRAKERFGADSDRRRKAKEADLELDIDVDLGELDDMSDDEFLAKLGADDDDARDTERPPAPSADAMRVGGMAPYRAPTWDTEPPPPDPAEYFPHKQKAPTSLSPDTVPQAFRPISVQGAQSRSGSDAWADSTDRYDTGPRTDPAPPPPADSRPKIRPIPPRAQGPASTTQVTAKPSPARPTPGDLSDDRVRQLYAQYIREKRMRGESTATTTFESVAKSLRSSTERLRGQHAGKEIDFEVAEKDGRTILRPVVK